MDPIKTIGKILKPAEDRRDAIHIAIVPVIAGEDLWPGNPVCLVHGTTDTVKRMEQGEHLGVVDPFLHKAQLPIRKGQRFWMFLNPNTVTGMRHEWTHPAFDQPHVAANESELWLRKFADRWNFDYDEMIDAAQGRGEYITAMGIDLHGAGDLGTGEEDEFWRCIEALTGKQFSADLRNALTWTCSC